MHTCPFALAIHHRVGLFNFALAAMASKFKFSRHAGLRQAEKPWAFNALQLQVLQKAEVFVHCPPVREWFPRIQEFSHLLGGIACHHGVYEGIARAVPVVL